MSFCEKKELNKGITAGVGRSRVTKRAIAYWENGERRISVENADKVFKALNATIKLQKQFAKIKEGNHMTKSFKFQSLSKTREGEEVLSFLNELNAEEKKEFWPLYGALDLQRSSTRENCIKEENMKEIKKAGEDPKIPIYLTKNIEVARIIAQGLKHSDIYSRYGGRRYHSYGMRKRKCTQHIPAIYHGSENFYAMATYRNGETSYPQEDMKSSFVRRNYRGHENKGTCSH